MNAGRRPSRSTVVVVVVAAVAALVGAGLASAGETFSTKSSTSARSARAGVVVIETNLGLEGARAAGTGMVLTSAGEVLTNNHVIEGATSIKVVIPGTGRSYQATVVGYDVGADTAVLQLRNGSGLATVAVGDSSRLTVGQLVRAVGNAGGAGSLSASIGQVTGLGQTITAGNGEGQTERLRDLIEIDAALRPGDSGGPLVTTAGRVVGMNTAASTGSGPNVFTISGVTTKDGYAIPINHALGVAKQIRDGHASATVHIGPTAFLGIQTAASASSYGGIRGAVIAGVIAGSPAARAGLQQGDVITMSDGRSVGSPSALVKLLLQRHPGDRVTVTWSDAYGTRHSASMQLASGPPQ